MATIIAYPSSLPGPRVAPVQSTERRLLSQSDDPFSSRPYQRDRHAIQQVTFPAFTAAQAAIFEDWYENTLIDGGAWFVATWPLPEGIVLATRRFIGTPKWDYLSMGFWRVSGDLEVRGRGVEPVIPDPPSAWNPLDLISGQVIPICIGLTEDDYVATRTTAINEWEGGVRGVKSHDTVGKRYFELKVLSPGSVGDTQNLQFGLVDATQTNILSRPPPSSSSLVTNLHGNFLLVSTRSVDGVIWTSYPTVVSSPGGVGPAPFLNDVFGFAWDIGNSIAIYRNGGLVKTVAFTSTAAMFPYMSAGTTNSNGPNTAGTGESVRIATGKKQFVHHIPTGFLPWG